MVPISATDSNASAAKSDADQRIESWLYNSYVEETLDISFEPVNNGRFNALDCFTRPMSRADFDYLYLSRRRAPAVSVREDTVSTPSVYYSAKASQSAASTGQLNEKLENYWGGLDPLVVASKNRLAGDDDSSDDSYDWFTVVGSDVFFSVLSSLSSNTSDSNVSDVSDDSDASYPTATWEYRSAVSVQVATRFERVRVMLDQIFLDLAAYVDRYTLHWGPNGEILVHHRQAVQAVPRGRVSIEVTVTPLQEVGDELAGRMHELLHTLPSNGIPYSLEWNAVDAEYDADIEGEDFEGPDFDDSDDDTDYVYESDEGESFDCLRCFW